MRKMNPEWGVVYKSAINPDGSLLFPERLTKEFLESARRTMGPYLYSNQYLNQCIPDGMQTFKKEWRRFYSVLPDRLNHFAFIDPAISEADTADYTGIVVVAVDAAKNWYVRYARRHRINPSQLIEMLFKIHDTYKTLMIGIEDVAFQRAILHFAHEEMKRRNRHIPITGVRIGTQTTKEMRILSLVPRMEMSSLFLTQGLDDLLRELDEFPRGAHDDCLDALASMDQIVSYPNERTNIREPHPSDPGYEKWYIQQRHRRGAYSE